MNNKYHLHILIILITAWSAPGVSAARAGDLLFYESFNDITSIESNGGSPGANGWPTFSSGVAGSAADLSGSKSLCYPLDGNFSVDSGTIEMWIKPPNANHLGYFDINNLGRPNSWGIFKNRDHVIMEVKDEGNRYSQAWTPRPLPFDNEWHFIAAVWQRSGATTTFKICLDGTCKSGYDGAEDDSHPDLTGEFCVGWSGYYGHSQSAIDELRIWDFARSDAQIASDFTSQGRDRVRPVITLLGRKTVVTEIGSDFSDPGATATDDRDGDITSAIHTRGSPDTTLKGAYRISYNVSDQAGNPAKEAVRMVFVFDPTTEPALRALEYLNERMDQFSARFDIYSDFVAGGNHGVPSGWMGHSDILQVDPSWDADCFQGLSCFKNVWETNDPGWVGVRWLQPENNWGDMDGAGYDLTGATKLVFNARGAVGGEPVEFVAGGVTGDFPDSIQPAVSTGTVALTTDWRQYEIDLTGQDLSHVVSPFGWTVRNDPIFFVDDVHYDLTRPDSLRLIQSFEILDLEAEIALANVAYVYDNALALLAFLNEGSDDGHRRAKVLADTLRFALENDRTYTDGRLRNSYSSGDISDPTPGTAKLPGWWSSSAQEWYEDEFNVSTHTGNVAWAILALLSYYEDQGGDEYLQAAATMGDWVAEETWDDRGQGGFTAGYEGWEASPSNPTPPTQLAYKATEHNIDLYPAFLRLYGLTHQAKWLERAEHARRFVASMWDPDASHFWTGTTENGEEINKLNVPVDIQAWAVMAMPGVTEYRDALYWASDSCVAESDGFRGFDFNCDDGDGVWFEGTAQMAVGFDIAGDNLNAAFYLAELRQAQLDAQNANGSALVAASHDGVTTGFDWEYFARRHIGATSWFILAEHAANPYWGARTHSVPVIRANGLPGHATISTAEPLHLTLDLINSTALGRPADWWVALSTAEGEWFYYRHPGRWFSAGRNRQRIAPASQAQLFDLIEFEVPTTPTLSPGSYTFYFGVDLVVDGALTVNDLVFDSVTVTIVE